MPLAYTSVACPLAGGTWKLATAVGDSMLGGAPLMAAVAVPVNISNRWLASWLVHWLVLWLDGCFWMGGWMGDWVGGWMNFLVGWLNGWF